MVWHPRHVGTSCHGENSPGKAELQGGEVSRDRPDGGQATLWDPLQPPQPTSQ